MGNDYFQFKQFKVVQKNCAMKVGMDGVMLGAWANCGENVLDIGGGTGIISLMIAQRFEKTKVTAVEIDSNAYEQMKENFEKSIFSNRLLAVNIDANNFEEKMFDTIVCNPPYFKAQVQCPQDNRNVARQEINLTLKKLLTIAQKLLSEDGTMSIILPISRRKDLEQCMKEQKFFAKRECVIRTKENKTPQRFMIEIIKQPIEKTCIEEQSILNNNGKETEWYTNLTQDFYLGK